MHAELAFSDANFWLSACACFPLLKVNEERLSTTGPAVTSPVSATRGRITVLKKCMVLWTEGMDVGRPSKNNRRVTEKAKFVRVRGQPGS